MGEKTKIILDTDPGGDDSLALIWLSDFVKKDLVELVAVTTVGGNVRAEQTFAGASRLLALAGVMGVEVGHAVPREANDIADASHIHGEDGMGGLSATLPEPPTAFENARSADEILIEKLNAQPNEITLVAVGPLTNLAAAERREPGILKKAKEIVVMGGVFSRRGNITPVAEFNIAFDPEAAATVFDSGANLVLLPLDVTSQLVFTHEMVEKVCAANPEHPIAKFLSSLTEFMIGTALGYRETSGREGFLVHDAATLAYIFYPETLAFRRGHVFVERRGEATAGMTILDDRHSAKNGANAFVATSVDAVELLSIIVEDLKNLIQITQ